MMISLHRRAPRRGFSLTVVLLFILLLMYLWAVVYRTTGSLIRIQTARVQNDVRDAGMLNALGQALMYMEHHATDPLKLPVSQQVFTVQVRNAEIDTWDVDHLVTFSDAAGKYAQYTVKITPTGAGREDPWTVEVSAHDSLHTLLELPDPNTPPNP